MQASFLIVPSQENVVKRCLCGWRGRIALCVAYSSDHIFILIHAGVMNAQDEFYNAERTSRGKLYFDH